MVEEVWVRIPEFPDYEISNLGRVGNIRRGHIMQTSLTNFGHVKITLKSEYSDARFTRSVATLVAEAFVDKPESNQVCDHVIILDGDFSNIVVDNLAWRPKWFAWKYTHQLKTHQPIYYHNLIVHNKTIDRYYDSVVDAGMMEGMLFDDIWRSTYTAAKLFPYGYTFEISERV